MDPALPPGVSFADVLKSVAEIRIHTVVPGYLYGFTNFDVSIDNISITAVPEPATYGMMALGLVAIGMWRSARRA